MQGHPAMPYRPATKPSLYFIGVSTGASSIMRVFLAWAEHLGLADAARTGIDFPPTTRRSPAGPATPP